MRLVLFQPDNPRNLGAAIRLAACFATPLDIIEPCGFALQDKDVRRTALDYGDAAEVVRHTSWAAFSTSAERASGRLVLLTTRGATSLWDFVFAPSDLLVLGRESAGVPDDVHAAADARVRIPIAGRSLNVVIAGAIALGEASRQQAAGNAASPRTPLM